MDEETTRAKRIVLRMVPYGLYVVSAGTDEEVNAFTANWLTQAGFEPPMVALAVATDARTLGIIRASRRFAVNFIADGNVELMRRLGKPHFKSPDKMEGIALGRAAHGTPVLTDALGYVECELRGELEYGADHLMIVGEVVDARADREGDIQLMQSARMKYSG